MGRIEASARIGLLLPLGECEPTLSDSSLPAGRRYLTIRRGDLDEVFSGMGVLLLLMHSRGQFSIVFWRFAHASAGQSTHRVRPNHPLASPPPLGSVPTCSRTQAEDLSQGVRLQVGSGRWMRMRLPLSVLLQYADAAEVVGTGFFS